MRRLAAVVFGAGVLATCAACSQVAGRADAAATVAERFHHAVAAGDGRAACSVLTPSTADALTEDGKPCAAAVLAADVPSATVVRQVQVWGRAAQVTMAGDVVFLAMNDGRWTVRAAGCTPRDAQPYQCQIQGG